MADRRDARLLQIGVNSSQGSCATAEWSWIRVSCWVASSRGMSAAAVWSEGQQAPLLTQAAAGHPSALGNPATNSLSIPLADQQPSSGWATSDSTSVASLCSATAGVSFNEMVADSDIELRCLSSSTFSLARLISRRIHQ